MTVRKYLCPIENLPDAVEGVDVDNVPVPMDKRKYDNRVWKAKELKENYFGKKILF